MAANDDIRDELVRHNVELMRFSRGLARRMRAIINRAEPRFRAELKARLDRITALGFDTGPATTRRMRKLRQFIKEINDPTFAEVNRTVRSELTQLAKLEVATASVLITGELPVLVALTIPEARVLRSIVFARPMEKKILRDWLASYEINDRRRMMDEIRQGLIFNETPTQISRRIFGRSELGGTDGVREITRRGAQTLSQTTSAAVFNGVLLALYAANKRIVKKEVYVATLDSRTTPICRSLDGKVFPQGEGPKPPIHLNCRSVRVPAIDGRGVGTRPANAATEKQLAGLRGPARRRAVEKLVGQIPAETTYQQWLTRQSVSFQNEVLGPTRGVLFRKGGLTLDQFVDSSGHEWTLAELWTRERSAFNAAGITANLVPGL